MSFSDSNYIRIDGGIGNDAGEISSRTIKSQLALADKSRPLTVSIHSEGGSVFEAMAIFDALRAFPGRKVARIESAAFSAASFIAMACDEISITENGFMMIHNPAMTAAGDANDLRNQSELLTSLKTRMTKAYASRSGLSEIEVERMMNQESWIDAQQAVELGFADKVIANARTSSRTVTARMPLSVVAAMASPKGATATARWRTEIDEAAKRMPRAKAVFFVDKQFPGLRERMVAEANAR